MRILTKPVRKRFDRSLKGTDPPVDGRDHVGPSGKPSGQFLGPFGLGRGKTRLGCGVPQGRDQRGLGPLGQGRRFDRQHPGDIEQQLASDSAAVVFDQIEVRGADANLSRQVRLLEPGNHPSLAYATACQTLARHICPLWFSPCISMAFCTAS